MASFPTVIDSFSTFSLLQTEIPPLFIPCACARCGAQRTYGGDTIGFALRSDSLAEGAHARHHLSPRHPRPRHCVVATAKSMDRDTFTMHRTQAAALLRYRCGLVAYDQDHDEAELNAGSAAACLPILRFLFLNFSEALDNFLRSEGHTFFPDMTDEQLLHGILKAWPLTSQAPAGGRYFGAAYGRSVTQGQLQRASGNRLRAHLRDKIYSASTYCCCTARWKCKRRARQNGERAPPRE